jgi:hypothetical protein
MIVRIAAWVAGFALLLGGAQVIVGYFAGEGARSNPPVADAFA